MTAEDKSREELLDELSRLRQQVTELEARADTEAPAEQAGEPATMGRPREEAVRAILGAIAEAIVVVDGQGRIVLVNGPAEQLLGYGQDELLGQPIEILVPERFRDVHVAHCADYRASPRLRPMGGGASFFGRRKDGAEFPAEISLGFLETREGLFTVSLIRDISQRKRAEEGQRKALAEALRVTYALQERDERLRAYANALPDLAFVLDKAGRYLEVLTGEDSLLYAEAARLRGCLLHEVLPPEVADLGLKTIRRTLATGQPQSLEYALDVPAGLRWFEGRMAPLGEAPGSKDKVIMVARDITERRQMEEQLRIIESAVASSINAIAMADLEGNLNYVNDAFLKMWGYEDEGQVLGKSAVLFWQEQAKAAQVVAALWAEGSWIGELVASKADGSLFDAQLSASMVTDEQGQAVAMLASFVDVSDRRRTEEQLRLQGMALDAAANGIVITDCEGLVIWVNPAFTKLTGYTIEEVRGRNLRLLKSSRQNRSFYEQLWATITAGQVWHGELVNRRKDDSLYIEEMTITPVLDAEGEITYFIAVKQDVTKRRHAEEMLQQTAAKLARSNQDLEQFAYVASHDLQQPLSTVMGFLDLLQRLYGEQLDADANEYIAYAMGGAKRMQELIRGLLEYSRVGAADKPLERVDGEVVLGRVIANLRAIIEETASVVTHDPLPTVMANPVQLEQLFQNLINNAIKFRGEEPPRVHISAKREEKEWVFSVRDNGIGIPRRAQERIFLIFQRLHTQEEYPGTGIGLAICKRIVERHGGRVWVESEPGEGATFYFTLPVVS